MDCRFADPQRTLAFGKEANAKTFERIARELHTNKLLTWRESTAKHTIRRREIDWLAGVTEQMTLRGDKLQTMSPVKI